MVWCLRDCHGLVLVGLSWFGCLGDCHCLVFGGLSLFGCLGDCHGLVFGGLSWFGVRGIYQNIFSEMIYRVTQALQTTFPKPVS